MKKYPPRPTQFNTGCIHQITCFHGIQCARMIFLHGIPVQSFTAKVLPLRGVASSIYSWKIRTSFPVVFFHNIFFHNILVNFCVCFWSSHICLERFMLFTIYPLQRISCVCSFSVSTVFQLLLCICLSSFADLQWLYIFYCFISNCYLRKMHALLCRYMWVWFVRVFCWLFFCSNFLLCVMFSVHKKAKLCKPNIIFK